MKTNALMNILIIVPSLHIGGTERQAVVLANALHSLGYTVRIATLYSGGILENDLLDVPIERVNKSGRWDIFSSLIRLKNIISQFDVDVTYTFLGTPNIMGAMLKPFISSKLIWGIRASEMHLSNYGWLSRLSQHIEIALSRTPDLIISNSNAGKRHVSSVGYPEKNIQVISNGIDTTAFCSDRSKRQTIRETWGIQEEHWLIGLSARIDPIKDHTTFLKAARLASDRDKSLRFVCIGEGNDGYVDSLKKKSRHMGLEDRVIWAGLQTNMKDAYNALDLLCLCSLGEGFPNALAEAMACGIPCASTNVGDAAYIIGDTGMTVKVGDHESLASAFLDMREKISNTPDTSSRCRERIINNFSIEAMIAKTVDSFNRVLKRS